MSRRPAALLVAALLGVLVAVGLALSTLGGLVLGGYLAVVAVGLGLLLRQARRLVRHRAAQDSGRTCSCCTSTVFDPVEVR